MIKYEYLCKLCGNSGPVQCRERREGEAFNYWLWHTAGRAAMERHTIENLMCQAEDLEMVFQRKSIMEWEIEHYAR